MSITRVDYRERQRLTAADLRAEQDYRLAAAGRHHLGPHDWGVVRGLHVTVSGVSDFAVWPGVAIDGYGREIVVPEPVSVQGSETTGCAAILLYYCDRPEQLTPGRACQDSPPPRISQRFEIRVVPFTEHSVPASALWGQARGAGPSPARRPWPVLLARVGEGCPGAPKKFGVDLGATRYVRHRAAQIVASSGHASLQLGLLGHDDLYHFLLSTGVGTPSIRVSSLAIDRAGEVHVWRQLLLTGRRAAAQVAFQGAALTLETAMVAGAHTRVRFDGVLDLAGRSLAGALTWSGPGMEPVSTSLGVVAGLGARSKLLSRASNTRAKLERPRMALARIRRAQEVANESAAVAAEKETETSVRAVGFALAPFSGLLQLRAEASRPVDARPARCGEEPRSRAVNDAVAPVILFRPARAVAFAPSAREVLATTVSSDTDLVPRTALHLSGGAFDEGDGSARIAFGRSAPSWTPFLQVSATGAVHLPERDSLRVTGAVYLPQIGPADPLWPDLLALAFAVGLPRATGRTLAVTVKPPADCLRIVRGDSFGYTVTLDQPVVAKRTFEMLVGRDEPNEVSFRAISNPLPATTSVDITGAVARHRGTQVALCVVCVVQDGSASRAVVNKVNLALTS